MSSTEPRPKRLKENPPPRKYGLHQVYPDPSDPTKVTQAKNAKIESIIALHGLDAQSPTTWIAWRVDGDPQSGDVHWLRDGHMLPKVIPDSRILTYDWNANYDKIASNDIFLGHADTLLDRIYMDREEAITAPYHLHRFLFQRFTTSQAPRAIELTLSLLKALVRASERCTPRGNKYSEILHSTAGVAFLGTPFQSSWDAGYTAAQLRIAVAIQTGSEHSQELIQYLQRGSELRPSPLDELVHRFCEVINHNDFKIKIVCFYETRATNFSAVRRRLPEGYAKEQLDVNGHGIVVRRYSACLQVGESVGLDVRHNMLHKFNDPKDDGFRRLSSRLKEFAEYADEVLRRRDNPSQRELSDPQTQNYLKDLRTTNPHEDKKRIEQTKGGLLEGSYSEILSHSDYYQKWRDDKQSRLLWIKGDPGKGKTMLLCGIVNEMSPLTRLCDKEATTLLSYFFFQATDSRINSAMAVLRGLVCLLIDQQPSLVSHVREKYNQGSEKPFEGANAWAALSTVFENILQDLDLSLKNTYLIVDGLDECETDLTQLLNLVVQSASTFPRVKWIVSSRNIPDIEARLRLNDAQMRLNLELDEEHVSRAVEMFIDFKVSKLPLIMDDSALQETVRHQIYAKAGGTFLWAALVLKELEPVESWDVLDVLQEMPRGLEPLYDRMMRQVQQLQRKDPEFCRLVLSTMILAYRPLHLLELGALSGLPGQISNNLDNVVRVVNKCGSFLTIRKDRTYFIHYSAKDFLQKVKGQDLFPEGVCKRHYIMFSQSMKCMEALKPDMYDCGYPGLHVTDIQSQVSRDKDPLLPLIYSCESWVDHLKSSNGKVQDGDDTHNFLKRHFLHWLEVLSLIGAISKGIGLINELQKIVDSVKGAELSGFLHDAMRFIRNCRPGIDTAPLQLYSSALIFAPESSIIRETFQEYIHRSWITTKPIMERDWSPCLQTLEGHNEPVFSVAFSNDSKLIISGSYDKTIKIWDPATGSLQQTLEGHSQKVTSVTFSHDSKLIASASDDGAIKIWDTVTGFLQRTFEGHDEVFQEFFYACCYPRSVAFSYNSKLMASVWNTSPRYHPRHDTAPNHGTIKVWDTTSWTLQQIPRGSGSGYNSVAFSHDSKLIASDYGHVINIWDTTTWILQQTLEGHSSSINSVAFSHNSHLLASGSDDDAIKIWDMTTWTLQRTLKVSSSVNSVAFSHNSHLLASGSDDGVVKIWDTTTWTLQQIFEVHGVSGGHVHSVVFSHDSKLIACGSWNQTIKIWDTTTGSLQQKPARHRHSVQFVAFSPNSRLIASTTGFRNGQRDCTIKIWDTITGSIQQTLKGHRSDVESLVFSPDSNLLVSGSWDHTVMIWNITTGSLQQTFEGHNNPVKSVAFSHDSKLIASGSSQSSWSEGEQRPETVVKIWDTETGSLQQTLENDGNAESVAFSHDSQLVLSRSYETVKIWETATWSLQQTLKVASFRSGSHNTWFDATGSYLLTACGSIRLNAHTDSYDREPQAEDQYGTKAEDRGAAESTQAQSRTQVEEAPRPHGWSICSNGSWITWKGKDALWLLPDYRPSALAISLSAGIVALGCPSGRVLVISFSGLGPRSPSKPQ